MANDKVYNVFISHRWKLDPDYIQLEQMLNSVPGFKWKNRSNPNHDPTIDPNNDDGLRKLLADMTEQIHGADCMLLYYGDSPEYRMWVQESMEIAEHHEIPIIGLLPTGMEVLPQYPQFVELEFLPWNASTIVEAIKKQLG